MVVAVVLGLGAVGLGVLAVAVCFGLTAEYGVGGSGDVPLYVAFFALPVLAVSLAGSIPAGLWLNESRHAQQSRT